MHRSVAASLLALSVPAAVPPWASAREKKRGKKEKEKRNTPCRSTIRPFTHRRSCLLPISRSRKKKGGKGKKKKKALPPSPGFRPASPLSAVLRPQEREKRKKHTP